jgi:hypothetical protein
MQKSEAAGQFDSNSTVSGIVDAPHLGFAGVIHSADFCVSWFP